MIIWVPLEVHVDLEEEEAPAFRDDIVEHIKGFTRQRDPNASVRLWEPESAA